MYPYVTIHTMSKRDYFLIFTIFVHIYKAVFMTSKTHCMNSVRERRSLVNMIVAVTTTLQINNWLLTGTWLPMPTTGCTSWFWISSGALGSWRPKRFSPHIWQESGKDIFQVFDASTFKTKLTMVTAQLIYTLITLVPVPFLFASYTVRLSTTFNTMCVHTW